MKKLSFFHTPISLFLFNFTMYTKNAGNPLDYLHYSIRIFHSHLLQFPFFIFS